MRVLHQKSEVAVSVEALREKAAVFDSVCLDIGTGDGKRLYRTAKAHPRTLFIGVDPVRENMLETAQKSAKKPAKGGLDNLMLVIGAVEALPPELYDIADEITVYFPWGSLLESVIKPIVASLEQIRLTAVNGAAFTFITTYQDSYEGAEIEKRQLPTLSREFFEGNYSAQLAMLGFEVTEIAELTTEDVMQIGTQWAKRLCTGRARSYYRISGMIHK